MTCLEKNVRRLFKNKGKLFLVALDHPQYFGPLPGLENTIETAERILEAPLDGFIFNPGIFSHLDSEKFFPKILIVRGSISGSKFGRLPLHHPVFLSAEGALRIGADGVILMMIVGGNDVESICSVGKKIEEFHGLGLPVIVEILPHDPSKISDPDLTATGVRIATELGADVVKVFYTEQFHKVIEASLAPVILAGGLKTERLEEMAREAVEIGIKGFAVGRNIFSSENPIKVIQTLENILRG